MLFSIVLLLAIVYISFRIAPVEKEEMPISTAPDRLVCWQRWRSSAWIISHPISMPLAK